MDKLSRPPRLPRVGTAAVLAQVRAGEITAEQASEVLGRAPQRIRDMAALPGISVPEVRK